MNKSSNARRVLGAALAAALSMAATLSTAAAGAGSANTDFPPANPYLADSGIPIFHSNSGQSGAAIVPGPKGKTRQLKESDIIWKKLGPNDGYSIQYSGVYPNGKRVGWFGGTQLLAKLDPDTLETKSTYVLHKGKFYTAEEIENLFAKADKLKGQALLDALVPPLAKGIERGVQSTYRLLDHDHNLYMLNTDLTNGDQMISKFGDAVDSDPDSDIVLKGEFRLPHAEGERFISEAMNITYDGTLIIVTLDGTLFAVSRDFKLLDKIYLPDRETSGKEFMNAFVRNSMAIDEQGGIYLVSRTRLQRVQWTGSKLSMDPADGAWSETYPSGKRGSGTTPSLIGWHTGQDKMVVIGDGEESVMVFWRDKIPEDWAALKGYSRRVASVVPMHFTDDPNEHIKLENALVSMGNGVFVANDTPTKEVAWQGTFMKTAIAERYVGQTGGSEIKGGIKWQWNPRTRKLETAWKTPLALVSSICTPSANGLLYCVGMRDGVSTIEALDWETGKAAFHYLLGKSYRYSIMGGMLDVAPNGDIEAGAAGGYGIFRVRTPKEDRKR